MLTCTIPMRAHAHFPNVFLHFLKCFVHMHVTMVALASRSPASPPANANKYINDVRMTVAEQPKPKRTHLGRPSVRPFVQPTNAPKCALLLLLLLHVFVVCVESARGANNI